jgi:hypothetical protein
MGVDVGGAGVNVAVAVDVGRVVGVAGKVGLCTGRGLLILAAVRDGCGAGLEAQATRKTTSRPAMKHRFNMLISDLCLDNSKGNHTAKLAFLSKNPIIQIIWKVPCRACAQKAPL